MFSLLFKDVRLWLRCARSLLRVTGLLAYMMFQAGQHLGRVAMQIALASVSAGKAKTNASFFLQSLAEPTTRLGLTPS
jgi:hypothetical protein